MKPIFLKKKETKLDATWERLWLTLQMQNGYTVVFTRDAERLFFNHHVGQNLTKLQNDVYSIEQNLYVD